MWPLFSYWREGDANELRVLSLWPVRHTPGVERNWAPLWTLYGRVELGDTCEHELLWGLWRRRSDGAGNTRMSIFPLYQSRSSPDGLGMQRWSILYGLLGYERRGLDKRYRLFYVPFGDRWRDGDDEEDAPAAPEEVP